MDHCRNVDDTLNFVTGWGGITWDQDIKHERVFCDTGLYVQGGTTFMLTGEIPTTWADFASLTTL